MSLNVPDTLVRTKSPDASLLCSGDLTTLEKSSLGVDPSDWNGRKCGVYEIVRESVCPTIPRSCSWSMSSPAVLEDVEDNVGIAKSAVFIGGMES